jgi:hypothetical protein
MALKNFSNLNSTQRKIMNKVNVKSFGPALELDRNESGVLVQLLREGPAQNLRVPAKDVTDQAPAAIAASPAASPAAPVL